MSKYIGKTWQYSPMIREALREREPSEVSVVICDGCGSQTYYNDGSHCSCEHCGRSLHHLVEDDGDIMTVADLIDAMAEGDDGP